MNWQHFRTVLWLRWRLGVNQVRRRGGGGLFLLILLLTLAALCGAVAFVASLTLGRVMIAESSPTILMFVWDGLIAAFLFFWLMGLVAELQRSEVLSLNKFLHLPISPGGLFLINYAAIFVSFSLIVFAPAMVGLSIAMVLEKGPAMLVVFPLVAGLLLLVTAVTCQFQGWLASVMVNKRRRRTIVTLLTLVSISIVQIPNLLNLSRFWGSDLDISEMHVELEKLDHAVAAGEIPPDEHQRQSEAIRTKYRDDLDASYRDSYERIEHIAVIVNVAFPPAWPAYGARRAVEGSLLPALLATCGLGLLGAVSLRRSYRTSVGLYTGEFTSGSARRAAPEFSAPTMPVSQRDPSSITLVERRVPWVSEHASAIAAAGFRSLTRAPEAKILLLTPVIMVVILGMMFLRGGWGASELIRQLAASGVIAMILLSANQLSANQFGFDRSGFRAFVLGSAARKDILLGKNLALAPLTLGLCLVATIVIEVINPMRPDHFLAILAEMIPMYLVYCMVSNILSIIAPMPVAAGSLAPAQPKGKTILLHLVFIFVFLFVMTLTMIPMGIEFLLDWYGWSGLFPVFLALALVECVAVLFLYDLVLRWQGNMLQNREQQILEIVTSKIE